MFLISGFRLSIEDCAVAPPSIWNQSSPDTRPVLSLDFQTNGFRGTPLATFQPSRDLTVFGSKHHLATNWGSTGTGYAAAPMRRACKRKLNETDVADDGEERRPKSMKVNNVRHVHFARDSFCGAMFNDSNNNNEVDKCWK